MGIGMELVAGKVSKWSIMTPEQKREKLEYNRQHRAKHPELYRQYNREEYERRKASGALQSHDYKVRKRWRDQLKGDVLINYGGECQNCHCDDWDVLTIDHVHGGGNKLRQADWRHRQIFQLLKNKPRDANFRILCRNCNELARLGRI